MTIVARCAPSCALLPVYQEPAGDPPHPYLICNEKSTPGTIHTIGHNDCADDKQAQDKKAFQHKFAVNYRIFTKQTWISIQYLTNVILWKIQVSLELSFVKNGRYMQEKIINSLKSCVVCVQSKPTGNTLAKSQIIISLNGQCH